ncbi:hypothetical protein A3E49_00825 [Candidatus Saccharibacteria bacterium RIFCSPHIGHO2_12_FULL_49_19]|nr:MAG: hypothetical protein A2708_02475 [Candidatus Saccharibacteria bacterium RIFCSPHIGHO2_01_FULL_49_21]OGL36156.1 MAG: hypothetical protein A3E49_00825 [Candidatus Saccharibacteria bacterium RIFCSPHIGHO2_12_FULL_49_19]OGL38510.1 MAG: hypothetical protein A3B63_00855 [Candidatus Saccharibacteria bacterium RIFCSPLOWO2_01_FULL_49_22]
MSEADWWKTSFDQRYLDTYLHGFTPERTKQEVDYVVKTAQLKPDETILDLACGHGRHSIELAKRGFTHVIGLDYSETFVTKAKADALASNVAVRFIRGDMKELPFENEFDAVLLLFTAFGYFDDESNKRVLGQINKALRPSGRFFVDVVSGEAVIERFKREGVTDTKIGQPSIPRQVDMGGHMVNEVEWFDPDKQAIHTHREWQDGDDKKEYDYYLHVYTMPQFERMLTDAGFAITETWGDYDGNPHLSEGTFRTILLAKKV